MSVDDAVALVEVRACGGGRLCMPSLQLWLHCSWCGTWHA
jgi:hypothetical protein